MTQPDFRSIKRQLILNGGFVMLFGFAAGFAFVFFILGSIELWPIPGKIAYQLPGTDKAWRMTHLEGVINGLMLWLLAAVLPTFELSVKLTRRVAQALIITAWTFPIASLFDALFKDSRGLRFVGPITNIIPFFLFYIGIITLIWAVLAVIVATWRQRPD